MKKAVYNICSKGNVLHIGLKVDSFEIKKGWINYIIPKDHIKEFTQVKNTNYGDLNNI